MKYRSIALASLVVIVALSQGQASLADVQQYVVGRVATAPEVDGKLDDESWKQAQFAEDFITLGGGIPKAESRFAMLWNADKLFVAIHSEGAPLVVPASANERSFWQSEHVELFLAKDRVARENTHVWQIALSPNGLVIQNEWKLGAFTRHNEPIGVFRVNAGKSAWTVEMALPLREMGMEPKPGLIFFGNVCRTHAIADGFYDHSSWALQHSGFHDVAQYAQFVLADFVANRTETSSSDSIKPAKDGRIATVRTRYGDVIRGCITSFVPDGVTRITGSVCDGDVLLLSRDVVEILMGDVDLSKRTATVVRFRDSEELLGSAVAFDGSSLQLETAPGQIVSLPSSKIAEVFFSPAAGYGGISNFARGLIIPREVPAGDHWFANGSLYISPLGFAREWRPGVFRVQVSPTLPFTCVAKFASTVGGIASGALHFYTSGFLTASQIGRSLSLRFPHLSLYMVDRGTWTHIWTQEGHPLDPRGAEMRFAYNPTSGEYCLWVDGKVITKGNAPQLRPGPYFALVANGTVQLHSFDVLPGIVPPGSEKNSPDKMLVMLLSGDEFTPQRLSLSDGKIEAGTEFGIFRSEMTQVARIRLGALKQRLPELQTAMCYIIQGKSCLVARIENMDEERIVATAPVCGKVIIDRRNVSRIVLHQAALESVGMYTSAQQEAPSPQSGTRSLLLLPLK